MGIACSSFLFFPFCFSASPGMGSIPGRAHFFFPIVLFSFPSFPPHLFSSFFCPPLISSSPFPYFPSLFPSPILSPFLFFLLILFSPLFLLLFFSLFPPFILFSWFLPHFSSFSFSLFFFPPFSPFNHFFPSFSHLFAKGAAIKQKNKG